MAYINVQSGTTLTRISLESDSDNPPPGSIQAGNNVEFDLDGEVIYRAQNTPGNLTIRLKGGNLIVKTNGNLSTSTISYEPAEPEQINIVIGEFS